MQTRKKDDNVYVKEPDFMDEYFLNILKRFFSNTEDNIKDCAETIIIEAIKRAKKEILFKVENSNVLSVNTKTGDVVITLNDLGGEPEILKKYSAFNKPFGNEADTVCEGNDPRLSDKREPKAHDHDDIYIRKLKVDVATTTSNGFMSWEDKIKLNGLENYIHPDVAGFKHIPAGGEKGQYLINIGNGDVNWCDITLPELVTNIKDGLMYAKDKIKLDGIEDNANYYIHPDSHAATMITEDDTHRFVTDKEKEEWSSKASVDIVDLKNNGLMTPELLKKLNGIEEYANNYEHPSGSGNEHIPSGGVTGDVLTYKADGKAKWATPAKQSVEWNEIKNKDLQWDDIKNKPQESQGNKPGNKGQIYYINKDSSNEVLPSYLLYKANAVNTKSELDAQKEKEISFADVFNNWKRFSHSGDTQPANPAEMQNWNYNSSSDSVICTVNSVSYIGFISNDKYSKYTHDVTVKSTDGDDDRIGVVIAFATDEAGKEHTISALRQTENQPYWFLVYDYMQPTTEIIGRVDIVAGDEKKGWSQFPNGCKIRIERDGDIINAYTSVLNSTTIDASTKLTLNLSSNEKYSIFRGACSYGYACQSQNSSTFCDIKFTGGLDNCIYDVANNQVWKYDNGWSLDSSKNIIDDIGIGRFILNENTGKLFFINSPEQIILCNQSNFEHGNSTDRPSNPKVFVPYFDTTINKLIMWNGSHWIDSMGTVV